MQVLKSIGEWLKKWWAALLVGLAVVGGAIGLYVSRRRVGRLLDQLAADKAVEEITKLRVIRDAKVSEAGEVSEEVRRIDDEIDAHKRAIVEAHEHAEGLTDDEVEAEFARLGY